MQWMVFWIPGLKTELKIWNAFAERAAKVAEQQERERAAQQQQPSASPRAGTPVGALMGVVPPPTPMGMLNQQLTPVAGKNRS